LHRDHCNKRRFRISSSSKFANADETIIATWFIADDDSTSTYFPQIGAKSDGKTAQHIYWRCVATFFASSLAVNPRCRHRFYTNTEIPEIDGFSFRKNFAQWGVEVVFLSISYRLPPGRVSCWGNQFYIFDIIKHIASDKIGGRHIVLDSDCIWIKPVDQMEDAINRFGILTYDVYRDEVEERLINGVSRRDLASFYNAITGEHKRLINYCGGEIFACRTDVAVTLALSLDRFWAKTMEGVANAPQEEAHLLSVLYAHFGYRAGTADPFIRRIWTSLRLNNARREDLDLAIWHLPAEKRTGLARLFRRLRAPVSEVACIAGYGFNLPTYRALFGVPRRSFFKLARDIGNMIIRQTVKRISK
jgi:hypothetical protein